MKRDWGWVELLTAATGMVRARGHLFASKIAEDGTWEGELDSLHLVGHSELTPGIYIARFERGREYQHVSVRVHDGRVEVRGEDHALPAAVLELAEGE